MERNLEFGPNYSPYDNMGYDPSIGDFYKDNMFNPMLQYEQAYMYYRCMCMQLDYKMKCKEYEKMCDNKNYRNERRVE